MKVNTYIYADSVFNKFMYDPKMLQSESQCNQRVVHLYKACYTLTMDTHVVGFSHTVWDRILCVCMKKI